MTNLHPFSKEGVPAVEIRAEASLKGSILFFRFEVTGAVTSLRWPTGAVPPSRRSHLWEHTCFEAFVKGSGTAYWEINVSPAGDWNIFRFDDYRVGKCDEERVLGMNIRNTPGNGTHLATWSLDLLRLPELEKELRAGSGMEISVGLTTVVEDSQGEISYWAIRHSGEKPDFHLAGSFIEKPALSG